MNAFDEATLKKTFGGSKPSSKLSSKTKWYHSYSCYDNSQSCEQLKKCVTDNYYEKITFCFRKCMLLLQYFSDGHLHGVYGW